MLSRRFPVARRTLAGTIGIVAVALTGFGQAGQAPRTGTAEVYGRVIDGSSRVPLADAVVTLAVPGAPPQRVIVDPQGRFVFPRLPSGAVTLSAAHGGYFGNGSVERDPAAPGRTIDLADGEHVTDLSLTLWRLGAITGSVTADGEPLINVEVRALRRTLVAGQWRLTSFAATATDDRGIYRLSGLVPGDYVVAVRPDRDPETSLLVSVLAATPASSADVMAAATASGRGIPERDGRIKTYPLAFYRDAPSSTTATRVSIDAGTSRTSIDFHLRAIHGLRVSGRVTGLDGPAEGVVVHLISADSALETDPIDVAAAATDSDGTFQLSDISPGKYVVTLIARPPAPPPPGPAPGPGPVPPPALPSEPTWWARMPVSVQTTDVKELVVPVHKGVVVSGRVEFAGHLAPPAAAELVQLGVRLDPEAPLPPGAPVWRGLVTSDGRFSSMGVPPGRYFLRVTSPPRGWTIESARSGMRDLFDASVEVQSTPVEDVVLTLSDQPLGGVQGQVHDGTGRAVANATVLIFPRTRAAGLDTSAQARRFRLVRTAGNGSFGAGGLPSGVYLAVAVPNVPASEWQDAKRLDALAAHATPVDLRTGQPVPPLTLTLTKTVPATVKQ